VLHTEAEGHDQLDRIFNAIVILSKTQRANIHTHVGESVLAKFARCPLGSNRRGVRKHNLQPLPFVLKKPRKGAKSSLNCGARWTLSFSPAVDGASPAASGARSGSVFHSAG
jgi:hypothetical protein